MVHPLHIECPGAVCQATSLTGPPNALFLQLQGAFDPQGSTFYYNRLLTPQQASGIALAPGSTKHMIQNKCRQKKKVIAAVKKYVYTHHQTAVRVKTHCSTISSLEREKA